MGGPPALYDPQMRPGWLYCPTGPKMREDVTWVRWYHLNIVLTAVERFLPTHEDVMKIKAAFEEGRLPVKTLPKD